MLKRLALASVMGAACLAASAVPAFASSHREAPLISQDPEADLTDIYAWVDQHNPSKVDLIMNAVPFELPSGAPNYYGFGTNVIYDVNVDRNGDGAADVTFRFRFARHVRNHKAMKAGLEALGLQYTAAANCQLPELNAVRIPDGVDDVASRKRLLNEFGIEIGGGLGDFKGKAWRIGLMGYNSRPNCVFQGLAAIEQVLAGAGVKIERGAGVAAAERAYAG